jgi:hypothetical protein
MASPSDVRRIALALPGAEKVRDRFAFGVRTKGKLKEFAWVWMERVTPKKPRVPNPRVLAVRVPSLAERDRLLAAHPSTLFTEPHYEGYPAVLVRLDVVRVSQLRALMTEGWRCRAPVDLIKRASLGKDPQ